MYMQDMPVNVPFHQSVTFQVRPPLLVLVDESSYARMPTQKVRSKQLCAQQGSHARSQDPIGQHSYGLGGAR